MGLVTHEATANMCMLLMKGYFAAGLGITEARQYHQHKLELTDNEAMLADATVNQSIVRFCTGTPPGGLNIMVQAVAAI